MVFRWRKRRQLPALLVGEIQLSAGFQEEIFITGFVQAADDGRAQQSTMAGNVDFLVFFHCEAHLFFSDLEK